MEKLDIATALRVAKFKVKKLLAKVNGNNVSYASASITVDSVKDDTVNVNIFAKGLSSVTDAGHVESQPDVTFSKEMKLADFAEQLLAFAKEHHHADELKLNLLKSSQTPEFGDFNVESSVIQLWLAALDLLMFEVSKSKIQSQSKDKSSKTISRTHLYGCYYAEFMANGSVKIIDNTSRLYQVLIEPSVSADGIHEAIMTFRNRVNGRACRYGKIDKYTKAQIKTMCYCYLLKNHKPSESLEIDEFLSIVSPRVGNLPESEKVWLLDTDNSIKDLPSGLMYAIVYFAYEIWKKSGISVVESAA